MQQHHKYARMPASMAGCLHQELDIQAQGLLPGTDSNPCLGSFFFISGGHLLSHAVTSIVPSAA